MTRRTLLVHAWLQLLLWIAIAVTINHISSAAFTRLDVTNNQAFTLSNAARHSVANLERPLQARVWFSEDLDPPFHNHRRALLDKLDELAAWSDGRLEIVTTDPTGDREAMAEARAAGIQPVPYVYKNWDREETRVVFMGVSFVYGERHEAVEALPSIDKMEYELVRAILAVTTEFEDEKKIGWLQGNGEPDLASFPDTNPLGKLRKRLQERHTLVPISPADDAIDEDIDTILVVGPQLAVSELAQFQLDQFVMRGGRIAWYISGFQPDFQTLKIREVRHNLHGMLGHYGVQLNRDVIVDRKQNMPMQAPVQVAGKIRYANVNYPLIPRTAAVDRTVPAVRNLKQMVFPFVSTLAVVPELSADVESEIWAQTGSDAVATRQVNTLETNSLGQPRQDEVAGPFPLVIALSGTFRSYFAGRTPPAKLSSEAEPFDPEEVLLDSRPTRMVVVSSSDMVANNLDFVLNTIDWLQEDSRLIEIRSRDTAFASFEAPPATEVWAWRLGIAGFPLILVLLVGAVQISRSR